jgi:ATP-binding cassette, subfamily F, member 3
LVTYLQNQSKQNCIFAQMLISFNNSTYEIGARAIIKDSSWTIFAKERIGLIGANGMGKSTALKLMVGEINPTGGTVEKAKEATIGYFHQDLQSLETEESILEVASHAFDRAKIIEKELADIIIKLETDSTDELLHLYSDKLHDFEVAGGYEMEHKTAQVLEGLGFVTSDLARPFKEFSGGWRMRVILAKMILQQPDLLLLDEPTNHLDLPSIEWLESFLKEYPGTVIIVSHDRYFLDRMVTKIVEISQQQFNIYGGNYSFYETEKDVRISFQQREYENQKEYIRQQERFIERFKAKASKAAAAQSAIKRLDKLDIVEAPTTSQAVIKINFNIDNQPGKIITTVTNVSKSYGPIQILKNANAEINRGDKIALIGANGKGKSTALRIIANAETFEGQSQLGHNVKASFYAQHQLEALDVNHEILQELKQGTQGFTEPELRSLLGCFLFNGDDVFKKIKVLSGGEKARVALAKTIISKCNFLMLDEPTNHLDLNSVNALAGALNSYQGTYIIVSHDRYFLQKTANKIWEIIDGKINEFVGSYDEWQEHKTKKELMAKAEKNNNLSEPTKPQLTKNDKPKEPAKPEINKNTAEYKDSQKELKRVQNQFRKVEEELEAAQKEKLDLENKLGDPDIYANKDKFVATETSYKRNAEKLNSLQKQYEEIFEQMMTLEN